MYIDIHDHLLFGVDDGSPDLETSVRLLKKAYDQGAEGIILTPHRRYGMFECPRETVDERIGQLREAMGDTPLKLYPGCEYHVCSDIAEDLKEGRIHTLADSDYVLTEFSHSMRYSDILRYVDLLIRSGYTPVIAHAERCPYLVSDDDQVDDIRSRGALIQLNAGSVLGYEGRAAARTCKRLLKQRLADVIAGDVHDDDERCDRMAECYRYVSRRYGGEYADELFLGTPLRMIGNE